MRVVGLVVIVGIVVTIMLVVRHGRQRTHPASVPSLAGPPSHLQPDLRPPSPGDRQLSPDTQAPSHLEQWVGAGLISHDQAAAIVAFELARQVPPPQVPAVPGGVVPGGRAHRRTPAVAEALGYVGGVLAVVGVALVVHRAWADLGSGGRLAVSATVALALAGAGLAIDERRSTAMARLRAVLWLGSSAGVALFMVVGTVDVLGSRAPATGAAAAAIGVALESCAFRWWDTRPVQQATFGLAVVVGAGAIAAELAASGPVGLTVWALGAVFVGIGVAHRGPLPLLTLGMGSMATEVGAGIVASSWTAAGLLLAVGTGLGLLALAAAEQSPIGRTGRVVVGVVGGLGLLEAGPGAIGYFADQAGAATGLVVWVVGVVLLEIGDRRLVRGGLAVELVGAAAAFGGAALTWSQWHGAAPLFGIGTAVALVVAGALGGHALLSLAGAGGLVVNVPWAIAWFFPGEGRVPLVVLVVGLFLVAIAVFIGRDRGRRELRHDVGRHRRSSGSRPVPHAH